MTVIRIDDMEFQVDGLKVSSPNKEWNARIEMLYIPDDTGLLLPEYIIVSAAQYYLNATIVSGDMLLTLNEPADTIY